MLNGSMRVDPQVRDREGAVSYDAAAAEAFYPITQVLLYPLVE